MDDGFDDAEEDPFTAKMSFEVRRERTEEIRQLIFHQLGRPAGAGERYIVHIRTWMCLSVFLNSRGAQTLSRSRWVAQCCAPWAGGTSWSNVGPGHSNGNTSAPCCLMWASPCAPPASRYSIYKTHGQYNLMWTTDKVSLCLSPTCPFLLIFFHVVLLFLL